MSSEIIVLSEIEAVRTNPSMYIGSVSNDGVHHLLFELVHNAIDEAIIGTASKVKVTVGPDFCSVEDNGRGISTEFNPKYQLSDLELVLTRLHSGSKFHPSKIEFTTGLHGVGLSCVNALSRELKVEISNPKGTFTQTFKEGVALDSLLKLSDQGSVNKSGTKITFYPDKKIFKEFLVFDYDRIFNFLNEAAFLNTKINFFIERDGVTQKIEASAGIVGLLEREMTKTQPIFPEPLCFNFDSSSMNFSCAIQWSTENDSLVKSFVNGVSTYLGGTHVNAFRSGMRKGIQQLINEYFKNDWIGEALHVDEVMDGVFAVLSLKLLHPNFEGQTKSRLTNFEVVDVIETEVSRFIQIYFRENSKKMMIIFERLSSLRQTRTNAKRVAERIYLQYGSKKINEEVYKKQFGERSKNWHSSAVWIAHDELLKSHADLFEGNDEAVALDVCCGSGVVGASFKHKVKKVIGLDLTPEMVALSKMRLDEVHQGNVYNIPFPDNSFDLVCTREVLHLLPYPENPVSEIFRVLKPGGQFIVGQILPFSEIDSAWMYRIFKKKQPLIYNMFQEEDFKKMLLNGGFVDLKMTEMNVWENIDVWINSYETSHLHRHEIREIYRTASEEIKKIHPFKILPNGEIHDLWRWCVFSVKKP